MIGWLGAGDDAPGRRRRRRPRRRPGHARRSSTPTCTPPTPGSPCTGLDLTGTRVAAEVLDAVAAHAAGQPADAVVLGHGWDESTLARPRPRRPRPSWTGPPAAGWSTCPGVDVHSALVLDARCCAARRGPGHARATTPTGWLRRDAHHAVRGDRPRLDQPGPAPRRPARHAAAAAALGIAAVHECGGPGISGEDDFTGCSRSAGAEPAARGVRVLGRARRRGQGPRPRRGRRRRRPVRRRRARLAHRRTCASPTPTSPDALRPRLPHRRPGRRAPRRLCTEHGLQAGFHAIGDAAIGTVLAGFAAGRRARSALDRLRAGRHRIEHVEMRRQGAHRRAGRVRRRRQRAAGVRPAVGRRRPACTPQRLGLARSLASNPFGAMAGVGVALAFGSDSPVTPLDPWGSVRAAVRHRNPAHRHERPGRRSPRTPAAAGGPCTATPTACSRPARRPRSRSGTRRRRPAARPAGAVADGPDGRRRRCRPAGAPSLRGTTDLRLGVSDAECRKLDLDPALVAPGPRRWPPGPAQPVVDLARTHTTVAVERATLRLAGVDRRRPGRHPVGEPARRRRRRRRSGWRTASPLPVFHAMRRDGVDRR